MFVALDGDSVLPRRASHARSRYFFRRERSAWKRRGELTAANPSLPSLPQHHGVQGRFHLLLHLRVRQRGSPRQARGPGARPIDGLLMSLATRAHRPLCRRSLDPSSGDAATPRPSNRPSSDGPTSSLVLPSHYRSPMPCSTRASPRTPTPRCARAPRTRSPALPARDRRGSPKRHLSETAVACGRASRPRAAPRPTWSSFLETRANRLDRARPRPPPFPPDGPVVPPIGFPAKSPPRGQRRWSALGVCFSRVVLFCSFTLRVHPSRSSDRSLTSSRPLVSSGCVRDRHQDRHGDGVR